MAILKSKTFRKSDVLVYKRNPATYGPHTHLTMGRQYVAQADNDGGGFVDVVNDLGVVESCYSGRFDLAKKMPAPKPLKHDLPASIYVYREDSVILADEKLEDVTASAGEVVAIYQLVSVGKVARATTFTAQP